MKSIIGIAFTILTLGLNAQITVRNGTGPHGGVLNVTKGYKIELVSSYGCAIVYLFDKDLTPIPNKNINGELLLIYSDNASINKRLNPYEDEGLMAEVTNSYYLYCIVTLKISDEFITTKFLNQSGFAEKKNKKLKK